MSMARGRAPRRRSTLPPVLRDWRAGAGLLALVVAVVVAIVALGGGGSDDGPPATAAARLAPADALAYVHVSTDGERGGVQRALAAARRMGIEQTLRDQLSGLLGSGSGAAPVDFERDVRPWLGDEAALALTRGSGGTAGSLLLLSMTDEAGARDFLSRTAGPARRSAYRGTATASYGNGTVSAFVDGFLAIGQSDTVRGAIERADGGDDGPASGDGDAQGGVVGSLADDPTYQRATADQPDGRVLDAYASVEGVRLLLAPQGGPLGLVGALLDQQGLKATALALTAGDRQARVQVRAVLDPRDRREPPTFTPTLTRSVPLNALAYLGFPGLERAAPLLLGLGGLGGSGSGAAGAAGGAAGALGGDTATLVREAGRLLASSGVSFTRDVLPLFGSEVAVVVVDAGRGVPGIALLARVRDPAATAAGLRRLEPAVARLFAPAGGAAPAFGDAKIGGFAARRLRADGGVELDYALRGDTLALSTSAAALAAVVRPSGAISDNPDYGAVIPDSQSKLTSIVFFDLSQLLRLFEPLGLTSDSGLGADLQRIRAVGLTSMSGEAQTTAELTFEIS
ncbi:DUF3352 domain-containing protein [Conexibacter sp. CPCC 206217]|uniref:DUF3352 domain-containing protein n=1 Tax=Conexibacter sp. CPCC 206217 TaxID=3064574 RepID=UPI0027217FB8|nr:DUF3352 domain-containing protein [Conexibacter sp. CPCC 206217]MDO8212743.1 DUF3352 domain-containing protein [Conexibacter sp. CPCC 206217]